MKEIMFSYSNARISKQELSSGFLALSSEILAMGKASKSGFLDDRSSINLPNDSASLKAIKALAKTNQDADLVIVVGIGGSNLGTLAVFEAIRGKYSNLLSNKKMLFADTCDPDSISSIIQVMKSSAQNKEKILLCFITKSGGTTETVANFEVLYAHLTSIHKKHMNKAAPQSRVVAITDEGSALWDLAKKENFSLLSIPKKVGGRYSVFSAVGLFPLAVIGINIDTLLKGANSLRTQCLQNDLSKNPAAQSALILNHHFLGGKNIHDTFLFANDLESIGKWYRQLMGESIGKEFDIKGNLVNCGMTPTTSIGSVDLHSMAQLYLGGPKDKFTTFITLRNFNSDPKTPNLKQYDQLVGSIQGKRLKTLMEAIEQGVMTAYIKNKRPFAKISLEDKSEESIGALLQLLMMQMMYLGSLLNVNPYDQPNVESYKIETKKILESSRG